jgi:hypothetical protein
MSGHKRMETVEKLVWHWSCSSNLVFTRLRLKLICGPGSHFLFSTPAPQWTRGSMGLRL